MSAKQQLSSKSWLHTLRRSKLTPVAAVMPTTIVKVPCGRRGHDPPCCIQGKDAYSLEKLSSDIPALVKALGHESCVLVAHDWGGVIAWLTAHAYSSMIDQLVVIAAPHPRCDYDWDQYKRWAHETPALTFDVNRVQHQGMAQDH